MRATKKDDVDFLLFQKYGQIETKSIKVKHYEKESGINSYHFTQIYIVG